MLHYIRRFLDELLLSSGQYTLFYIILAIAVERNELFSNSGLSVLFVMLLAQTILLVRFGDRSLPRISFSLISPLTFTLIQASAGGFSPLNMNLLFYWFTQLGFATAISLARHARKQGAKKGWEFAISMGTVVVFLFLTFYYDLMLSFGVKSAAGLLSGAQASGFFKVTNLFPAFREFLSAPTLRFVLLGSLIFGFTMALVRIRIISLKFRISYLFEEKAGSLSDMDTRQAAHFNTESAEVSVIWADIRNFSQVSESYPQESIAECLKLYLSTWGIIARKYGGLVDKHMGDAVMLVFGPGEDGDSPNRAVSCAVDFLEQLGAFQEEFAIRNLPVLKAVGIGVSCGQVLSGDIGGPDRGMRTLLGYPVSIASRMEGLSREFRQDMVIDQNVYRKLSLENQARFQTLGEILIRGRIAPMPVYGLK